MKPGLFIIPKTPDVLFVSYHIVVFFFFVQGIYLVIYSFIYFYLAIAGFIL